jgi:hypothetical protein
LIEGYKTFTIEILKQWLENPDLKYVKTELLSTGNPHHAFVELIPTDTFTNELECTELKDQVLISYAEYKSVMVTYLVDAKLLANHTHSPGLPYNE